MNKRIMQTVERFLLVLFLALILGLIVIQVVLLLPAYSVGITDYEKTDVMDDLSSIDGFQLADYPFIKDGRIPKLFNFVEYCYSSRASARPYYGLYIYIYNQSRLQIEDSSVQNKIQMAVAYDSDGKPMQYEKFDLRFCSVSKTLGYEKLFYKYKIVDRTIDGKTFMDRVNASERRYDVSGIELLTHGSSTAVEYGVGGTYKFTGYTEGCGADPTAESNLTSVVNDLETIVLDVHSLNFRPESVSSLGIGHQNELNSVYFGIQNSVIKEYGSLQKIKAEWYEYRTSPIVVLSDVDTYNTALPFVGKKLADNPSKDKFNFYDNACRTTWDALEGSYGRPALYNFNQGVKFGVLPYLFSTGSSSVFAEDYVLPLDTLKSYIESYDKSYIKGKTEKGYSADLFTEDLDSISKDKNRKVGYNILNIDSGEKYDLMSYDSSHSWWDKIVDFGLFGKPNVDEGFSGTAIQEINESDFVDDKSVVSAALLVGEEFIDDLKNYQLQNKNTQTTFLFRYAQSDYWSLPLFIHTPGSSNADAWGAVDKKHGYVAQENVFFDFDIIELTFNKDGVYRVIPVVSSPIDIINGVTPPLEVPNFWDWIKAIIGIVLLVLVLIVLAPILPYVFKAIIWVIALPFRAIGWIVKTVKNKGGDK